MKTHRIVGILLFLLATNCSGETAPDHAGQLRSGMLNVALNQIDPAYSLVVTDQIILAPFTLNRVLQQIITTSAVNPQITPLDLYHQWWDTQNTAPGLGLGPHCNDHLRPLDNRPSINDYPYDCPRQEGTLAVDANAMDPNNVTQGYKAIGLFNRLDLAPQDGSNCGEYRIEFGRNGNQGGIRNLILFEAVLPNPHPELGLEGCRPVAEFWANLSGISNQNTRRDQLDNFYFTGLPGFEAVVRYNHYGADLINNTQGVANGGQIRTNQFINPDPMHPTLIWNLREFSVVRDCRCNNTCGGLVIVPVTDKTNPYGPLFNSTSNEPNKTNFENDFFAQIGNLAAGTTATSFSYSVSDTYNSGQSISTAPALPAFSETDYAKQMDNGFKNQIEAHRPGGVALTGLQLVRRAEALSCAGCHDLSSGADLGGGVTFPSRADMHFTQVNERQLNPPGHGDLPDQSYAISGALTNTFIPARLTMFKDFLSNTHPSATPRNQGPRALPSQLVDPSCLPYSWRRVWPWEIVQQLRVDLGPTINPQNTH